jgi:hypothetical protein
MVVIVQTVVFCAVTQCHIVGGFLKEQYCGHQKGPSFLTIPFPSYDKLQYCECEERRFPVQHSYWRRLGSIHSPPPMGLSDLLPCIPDSSPYTP